MPHVGAGEQCSASFCCKHIGNIVLFMAKAIVTLWQLAFVCLLQKDTALHLAAEAGHVAVVKTLLLKGAGPGARNVLVSYSSYFCIFGIDTAYIAGEKWMLLKLFSCSKRHDHVSCLIPYHNALHTFVATILEVVCSLRQKQLWRYGDQRLRACCRDRLHCIGLQKQVM